MKSARDFLRVMVASALLACGLAAAGCLGVEGAEAAEQGQREDLQALSPSAGSVAAACKVCSIAIACCDAVGGGPECSFNASTCASLGGSARAAYVDGCEAFVKTVFTAWKYSPPAECH